jgi:hypothetical protein
MLEFPKNALACQLTQRLKNIVNWVSNKCNDEWTEYYAVELMDKLVAYSQPKDGSECLPEDHDSIGATSRKYNSQFQQENGITFNDHVKEQTGVGMQQYRQEQNAKKEQRKTELEAAKAERDERRQAAADKRQAIRDERERKREERQEKARSKLLRQQDAARLAYEAALAELKRQQAELMKLSTEVESIMNNEEQPVMLMDATDDIFLEVEEVEEQNDMDERRFGIRLEHERMEFNQFQEMNVPDYHIMCTMPSPSQWATMLKQAEERFSSLLAISQQQAQAAGGNKRALLAARLRTRFNEVIDFILSQRRIDVCDELPQVRCYDLDAVFGDLEVKSVERLIQHSTQLVEQLELECPRVLFATYYMTLDGKADKLL